ncbi:MAG TPA: winged helix-turn-helix domain-containing protein [Stackebrandtia sp.]|jgi:predicted ArsR family transcriptional regulator|uniref:ArsR/SmtB family transcription factor n=1 Tax=Stackebrandtia sp. TaxID=2023065 RepID=UPI002D706BB6|nr:winged helix-turn-helix domain-containing protein [Stackebrandtia sp.]HZE39549.1 winged helix-turn-helix domain-containing protein [Stackebrandtia sp.]
MASSITQADVMRALSHPTRIALLEALQAHPALTATEAADAIGETPTNCAFHLRALAKFGFIEEAGRGAGRRRPWRLADRSIRFSEVHTDEDTSVAAAGLSDVLTEHALRRIADEQRRRTDEPPEWREVFGGSQAIAMVTPEEMGQWLEDLRELLGRFDSRRADGEEPEGARAVQLFLFAQPFSAAKR